jgi:hypothetical protein
MKEDTKDLKAELLKSKEKQNLKIHNILRACPR